MSGPKVRVDNPAKLGWRKFVLPGVAAKQLKQNSVLDVTGIHALSLRGPAVTHMRVSKLRKRIKRKLGADVRLHYVLYYSARGKFKGVVFYKT